LVSRIGQRVLRNSIFINEIQKSFSFSCHLLAPAHRFHIALEIIKFFKSTIVLRLLGDPSTEILAQREATISFLYDTKFGK
jgi:hypothetical protein